MNFIYALVDPRTQECRYVGKTNNTAKRLIDHTKDIKVNHKTKWVKSLLAAGVTPELVVLEEVGAAWQDAECFWIAYMRSIGARLVNGTHGGEGVVMTDASKLLHSQVLRETYKDPAKRKAMSARQKEHCAKPAVRARRSQISKDISTPEVCGARSAYMKERWADPERRSALLAATAKSKVKHSETSKRKWQDPEYAANVRAAVSTPEMKAANAARIKALWADPEYRRKQMELRQSPEYKARKVESDKRGWEKRKQKGALQGVILDLARDAK